MMDYGSTNNHNLTSHKDSPRRDSSHALCPPDLPFVCQPARAVTSIYVLLCLVDGLCSREICGRSRYCSGYGIWERCCLIQLDVNLVDSVLQILIGVAAALL